MATGGATSELSSVVLKDKRRRTVVDLKHVTEIPLRNVLESFDKDGDGKIDIMELQRILYWYGLWKYASFGLCLVILVLIWSTFGLTIWAINLTKEYSVNDGVLTAGDNEVLKMSVASVEVPLKYASYLERRHLDALESLTLNIDYSYGSVSNGTYHMRIAGYMLTSDKVLKLYGEDGSKIWIDQGVILFKHPGNTKAVPVCGESTCNTLAVDADPNGFLSTVEARALPHVVANPTVGDSIDGVMIHRAVGSDSVCLAINSDSCPNGGRTAWALDTTRSPSRDGCTSESRGLCDLRAADPGSKCYWFECGGNWCDRSAAQYKNCERGCPFGEEGCVEECTNSDSSMMKAIYKGGCNFWECMVIDTDGNRVQHRLCFPRWKSGANGQGAKISDADYDWTGDHEEPSC